MGVGEKFVIVTGADRGICEGSARRRAAKKVRASQSIAHAGFELRACL